MVEAPGRRGLVAAGLAALLAGCGDLPQPFLGNPGASARRLTQPPPSRLTVPVPREALLGDETAEAWAHAVTDALVAQEIPAVVAPESRKGDWQLLLSAEMRNGAVVPTFTVQNPQGVVQGTTDGATIPASSWSEASPALLKRAADEAAPKLTALLAQVEAARRAADPNDLVNRPARLYFTGVTGAPGDGNTALSRQIRQKLAAIGQVTQDSARNADFALRGEVRTEPGANGSTRVEVQWIVDDAAGAERGRVVQLNEVPGGSVDRYWGDVAVEVATQAAGGVKEVLSQQTGRRDKPLAGPTPAA